MTAADRQKRFRARRKAGVTVLAVPVPETEVLGAMIDAGLVPEGCDDPAAYAHAAGQVLAAWAGEYSVTRYAKWLGRAGRLETAAPPRRRKEQT